MKVRSKMNSQTLPINLNDFYKYFMKLSSENVEWKSGCDLEWQEYVHKHLAIEPPASTIAQSDKIITKPEIIETINELKNGKAQELSRNSKKCLSNVSFVDLLHTLFNHCYDDSIFLSSWAEGIIIPLFKKVNIMTQTTKGTARFLAY